MSSEPVYIVYDGECPFCSAYTSLLKLRQNVGRVELVNARQPHMILNEVAQHHIDLDEGMAVRFEGRWFHGADCIHLLAVLSDGGSLANRILATLFRSRPVAWMLYPWLRAARNFTLTLLGRKKIGSARS